MSKREQSRQLQRLCTSKLSSFLKCITIILIVISERPKVLVLAARWLLLRKAQSKWPVVFQYLVSYKHAIYKDASASQVLLFRWMSFAELRRGFRREHTCGFCSKTSYCRSVLFTSSSSSPVWVALVLVDFCFHVFIFVTLCIIVFCKREIVAAGEIFLWKHFALSYTFYVRIKLVKTNTSCSVVSYGILCGQQVKCPQDVVSVMTCEEPSALTIWSLRLQS